MEIAQTIALAFLVFQATVSMILAITERRARRMADWLPMLADEGLALAQHAKAHHKANNLEFTPRDEEDEAIRWVLERAEGLKIKCTRAQAAKLVAVRASK